MKLDWAKLLVFLTMRILIQNLQRQLEPHENALLSKNRLLLTRNGGIIF